MPGYVIGRFIAAVVLAAVVDSCSVIAGDRLNDAQQVIADIKTGPSDLLVTGRIEGEDAPTAGKPMALSVQVSKPAYVAVLRVLANGRTTLVFPNRLQPSAHVDANAPVRIPPEGASLPLAPEKPGVVLFELLASTENTSFLFTRKPDPGSDFAGLGATTRALAKPIQASLRQGISATAQLTVRVGGE